jgi:hypothetical protein
MLNGASTSVLRTLEQHKRAVAMRRLAMLRPLPELGRIFRAQIGDPECQDIDVRVAAMYEPGPTFEEFLRINRLPVFERVLR